MAPQSLRRSICMAIRPSVFLSACAAATMLACAPEHATDPSPDADRTLAATSTVTYTVRDLGTLGGARSRAEDINNAGVVVGSSATGAGTSHAFRWENGAMTDLGTVGGGSNSGSNGINNHGVIVGWSTTSSGATRAVRWTNGVKRNLGTLGGRDSEAHAINDLGWIVGVSQTASGARHAFLWKNGVMTDLGALGGSSSTAWDITHAGVVVGGSSTSSGNGRAFHWKDGVMRAFAMPGMSSAVAYGKIGSYVVGEGEPTSSGESGEISNALLWVNGVMRDLGRMGGIYARAVDVNADGLVVGHVDLCRPDACRGEAFVWVNGDATFLPKVGGGGWAGATGINRAGHVVGFSETDIGRSDGETGDIHAVLWRRN
jgi:probable HAF family extracellular repeat protein